MKEAEILFPDGKTLEIAGESLTVGKMKLRQIIKATGLMSNVFDLVHEMYKVDAIDVNLIFKLFALHGDDMLEFLAIVLDKDRTYVDELDLDDAVELMIAVAEVNMDFFAQKLMPLVNNRLGDLKQSTNKT